MTRQTADQLDRIDLNILRILQEDGRLSNVELSRRVNLSPTPCLERVRRLERDGYIQGYNARLDPERLGRGLMAFIEVRLDRTTPDVFHIFAEAVARLDEIQECHMVAGGFDYLVKVRVADMAAYRAFLGDKLSSIQGVAQTHTYMVMEEVKSTAAIPVPGR
ncbi:MAG: Lrp/AsnC ligand binding domain-containing protein [Azospirillaceae bacterium]|nr:Lrp/AsnC ligand binding domain-containing protein [Azospirillaceae bacterium]